MRAAAGVTAFSSLSDFNLWKAYFVCFSHKKKKKRNQRRHMFLYFLCVSFLSTFLAGSNPYRLLIVTVWPV